MEPVLPRHLTAELNAALEAARVVNVIGPRQAGKTTLVRDLFGRGRFISLDNAALLDAIEADPEGQLMTLLADADARPLIIDEAQRSRKLALAIKLIVDANRAKGQFVLTGSSNVFTNLDVADSLAGRMQTIKLWPLSVSEVFRRPPSRVLDWAVGATSELSDLPTVDALSRSECIELAIRGGYPEIRDFNTRTRNRRYRDYLDAVVDRDVADVLRIRKTDALRRLINQLATRTACETNATTLSKLAGLQRPTVEQYIDVLLRLSIISRLPAWTASESKRDVKQPKYHFTDTGVAAALRQLTADSFAADADPTALGGIIESFAYSELLKLLPFQRREFKLYHWRTSGGREIDILAESDNRLVGLEIKASTLIQTSDFNSLRWFAENGPGRSREFTGIVLYLGKEKLSFGDRLFGLPLSVLWS